MRKESPGLKVQGWVLLPRTTASLLRLWRLVCRLYGRQIFARSHIGSVGHARDLATGGVVDADACVVEQITYSAIEFDAGLAARLAANFKGAKKVEVIQGDGAAVEFAPADVIYVNAGATRPASSWLDRLRGGGRLILPLTSNKGFMGPESGPIERRGAATRSSSRNGSG